MRCKTCDYALWNLRSRVCPECGDGFVPSDFDLNANAVRFCCPHCGQPYYGTDERGHLVPRAFDCVGCSRAIDMDEMVIQLAEGVDESRVLAARMPWLNPGGRGPIRRWWETVKMSLVAPGELARGVPTGSGMGPAWKFLLINMALVFAVALVFVLVFTALMMIFMGTGVGVGAGRGGAAGMFAMLSMQALQQLAGFVIVLLFVVLWGLATHGLLRLSGPLRGTLGHTFQGVLYSSGAYALAIVPCVGSFATLWWVVSAILMVRETQQVSGLRASLTTLALPVLSILTGIAAYIVIIWLVVAGMGAGLSSVQQSAGAMADTNALAHVVLQSALDNPDAPGTAPDHPARIIIDKPNSMYDFVLAVTATSAADIPLGDLTLGDLSQLTADESEQLVLEAAAALPQTAVAVRLGDFVFTYYGIDLATQDPPLWTVLAWPDPDQDGSEPMWGVTIGLSDGSAETIGLDDFKTELEDQNDLRTDAGLAPLPHPEDVTHDQPGVGP